ncbi:putative transcriptional regulator [Streptomyces clavuligerus]|uniref:Putative transcriptional regulator n=1 Tax=Streptomyces clavuligerus TaxID=1901 RepID=E2Q8A1_STRCL|nr:putative transcriptional regulator [Streptomyces clavuligerus]
MRRPRGGGGTALGTRAGFALRTPYGLDDLAGADTVVVPSVPDPCAEEGRPLPSGLITALRRAHDERARVVSLCTGAVALAEAGLLDGRRAAAHRTHTARLSGRYPRVRVDGPVLYVDVLTSAGLTAGRLPAGLPPGAADTVRSARRGPRRGRRRRRRPPRGPGHRTAAGEGRSVTGRPSRGTGRVLMSSRQV